MLYCIPSESGDESSDESSDESGDTSSDQDEVTEPTEVGSRFQILSIAVGQLHCEGCGIFVCR